MKKITSLVLCIALTLSMFLTMPISASAATQQQAIDWCKRQRGTFIEYSDSSYMYQCFDFVSAYANAVFEYKTFGAGIVYAKDLIDYNPGKGWTLIRGNSDLQGGDIFISSAEQCLNTAGHTGVIIGISGNDITVIDQNWSETTDEGYKNKEVGTRHRDRSKISGVLRPPLEGSIQSGDIGTNPSISNGTYAFKHVSSGKYVSMRDSMENGVGAILYEAGLGNGILSIDQMLILEKQSDNSYSIKSTYSGKVLDVSTYNAGDAALQYTWHGGNSQRWNAVDCGGGDYKFINKATNLALDVLGNGSANFTKIQQSGSADTAAQKFRLIPVTSAEIPDGIYAIKHTSSGKYVSMRNSMENGLGSVLYEAGLSNGLLNTDQMLIFERQADNSYSIRSTFSDKVLDVPSYKAGDTALQATWHGGDSQHWYIVDCGGGDYKIVNKATGLAIDVQGNSNADLTKIQQWQDNGTAAQKYRLIPVTSADIPDGAYAIKHTNYDKYMSMRNSMETGVNAVLYEAGLGNGMLNTDQMLILERQPDNAYSIKSTFSGKVLDVSNYSCNTPAIQVEWGNRDSQHWYIIDSGGDYKFINKATGLALDVAGTGELNNTKIQQWQDNGTTAQKFKLISVPEADIADSSYADIPNGTYAMKHTSYGKYISMRASTANGIGAVLYEAGLGNGELNTDQQLIFEKQADDSYSIKSTYSGKVLDVSSYNYGDAVLQFTWHGGDSQRWYVVHCEGGNYKFINKATGLAIDVAGTGALNDTKIQQWTDNGTAAQKFQLIPL